MTSTLKHLIEHKTRLCEMKITASLGSPSIDQQIDEAQKMIVAALRKEINPGSWIDTPPDFKAGSEYAFALKHPTDAELMESELGHDHAAVSAVEC